MKPLSITVAAFAILLSSCTNPRPDSKPDETVPQPLQNNDGISDVISVKRIGYGSLIQELYDDAVSRDPELKKLEKELSAFDETKEDSLKKVHMYKSKSFDFYNSSENLSQTVRDSTLKKKLSALIKASNEQYQLKTNKLFAFANGIEQDEINIKDYHVMLKLMVTLPIIEKYQDQQLRDVSNAAEKVAKTSKKLRRNTMGLVNKYEKAKK